MNSFFASGAGGSSGGFSVKYGDGLFGDGVDGDATIVGTVNLGRETYYRNLTITGTGALKPSGFRCFVSGTMTVDAGGSFNDDGASATGGVGATGHLSRQTLGFVSGGGGGGSSGGNGNTGGGVGNTSLNDVGLSPTGGKGGDVPIGNLGGPGGAATQPTQGQRWQGVAWAQQGRFNNGTAQALFNGGSGGGGGASSAATCTGGGGGAGGGGVWLAAKSIVNNGRISANGGNGGNGIGTAGDAGGGGGGGGGSVCVATLSSTYGVIQALGGTGGLPRAAGSPGADGRVGSTQIVVLS